MVHLAEPRREGREAPLRQLGSRGRIAVLHCIKIYADDIESKADRERYAKVVPTLILFDGAGREVTRVVGTGTSSPNVYSAMQKAAEPTFKKPLGSLVEIYSAFLKRFDKVAGQVSQLEAEIIDDLDHTAKHDCAPGRKKLKEHQDEISRSWSSATSCSIRRSRFSSPS